MLNPSLASTVDIADIVRLAGLFVTGSSGGYNTMSNIVSKNQGAFRHLSRLLLAGHLYYCEMGSDVIWDCVSRNSLSLSQYSSIDLKIKEEELKRAQAETLKAQADAQISEETLAKLKLTNGAIFYLVSFLTLYLAFAPAAPDSNKLATSKFSTEVGCA